MLVAVFIDFHFSILKGKRKNQQYDSYLPSNTHHGGNLFCRPYFNHVHNTPPGKSFIRMVPVEQSAMDRSTSTIHIELSVAKSVLEVH
jgi:hypothetical protein